MSDGTPILFYAYQGDLQKVFHLSCLIFKTTKFKFLFCDEEDI